MNSLVSNTETGAISVHFDSEITKVLIINISGVLELEKLIKTRRRFTIHSNQFHAGKYLVQFIKRDKVIDGLKLAIKI